MKGQEHVIKHRLRLLQDSLKTNKNKTCALCCWIWWQTVLVKVHRQWLSSTRWAPISLFLFIALGGWQFSMWNSVYGRFIYAVQVTHWHHEHPSIKNAEASPVMGEGQFCWTQSREGECKHSEKSKQETL